jgi:hypothetical protein
MAHIRIESPGIAAKVAPIWSVITNACLHGIRSASSPSSRHQHPFTDVFVAMQGRRGLVVQVDELVMQPIAVASVCASTSGSGAVLLQRLRRGAVTESNSGIFYDDHLCRRTIEIVAIVIRALHPADHV